MLWYTLVRFGTAHRMQVAAMLFPTLALSLAGVFLLCKWSSMLFAFVHTPLKPPNVWALRLLKRRAWNCWGTCIPTHVGWIFMQTKVIPSNLAIKSVTLLVSLCFILMSQMDGWPGWPFVSSWPPCHFVLLAKLLLQLSYLVAIWDVISFSLATLFVASNTRMHALYFRSDFYRTGKSRLLGGAPL